MSRRKKPSEIIVHQKYIEVLANNTKRSFLFDIDMLPILQDRACNENDRGYLQTSLYGLSPIRCHHLVIGTPLKGLFADHISRDKSDNRRKNLRIVTPSESAINRGIARHSKNGYKGVRYLENNDRWQARIAKDNKRISLGTYGTALEAAIAYDKAAREIFGSIALTNSNLGLLSIAR